mmetsp:Transcript_5801/g.14189  ORF Transcript_5801/g.14189 Transcript_5801/m.14189 type:complete len:224 (-) Transcript_5801:586-1257(-)
MVLVGPPGPGQRARRGERSVCQWGSLGAGRRGGRYRGSKCLGTDLKMSAGLYGFASKLRMCEKLSTWWSAVVNQRAPRKVSGHAPNKVAPTSTSTDSALLLLHPTGSKPSKCHVDELVIGRSTQGANGASRTIRCDCESCLFTSESRLGNPSRSTGCPPHGKFEVGSLKIQKRGSMSCARFRPVATPSHSSAYTMCENRSLSSEFGSTFVGLPSEVRQSKPTG